MTQCTHIHNILIGNIDKGTPVTLLALWTPHALPISVQFSADINVTFLQQFDVVEMDSICF